MTTTCDTRNEIFPVNIQNGWATQSYSGAAVAHWERFGKGNWTMTVRAFRAQAESLQIDTSERGTKSEKQTMVTLSHEQALALRDFLIAAYPPMTVLK